MNLFELKKQQKAALDKAEALLGSAGHVMTTAESENYNTAMAEYQAVTNTIAAREKQNTIRAFFRNGAPIAGGPFLGSCEDGAAGFMSPVSVSPLSAETRSPEYARCLHAFLKSGGKAHGEELSAGADGVGDYYIPGSEQFTRQRNANGSISRMQAATYEGTPDGGSGAAGGFAVSVPTVQQIAPLALPDLGKAGRSAIAVGAAGGCWGCSPAQAIKVYEVGNQGSDQSRTETRGQISAPSHKHWGLVPLR